MMLNDPRPMLPASEAALDQIKFDIMVELYGPPPPDVCVIVISADMRDEIDREMLKRYRLLPNCSLN